MPSPKAGWRISLDSAMGWLPALDGFFYKSPWKKPATSDKADRHTRFQSNEERL